jgi:peroxiredoxin
MHNKVIYYLDKVCIQHYDTIIEAVEYIIQKSKPDEEAYKYWVITLLNKYANTNIMGHEAVYVHIAEKYYSGDQAYWLDKADQFRIMDRAAKMKPTLIDKQAPALVLKDVNGKMVNLYSIDADYILLMFYDPDCGHCKKETPLFKSAFDSLKTIYNIKAVAVSITNETDKWKKFLKEFGIEDWYNLADLERVNPFREIYDIQSTPRLFLLDKDKFIRGKRFGPEQLSELLKSLERIKKEDKKKK